VVKHTGELRNLEAALTLIVSVFQEVSAW